MMKQLLRRVKDRGDRGTAIVEYAMLMGTLAAMSLGSVQLISQHVASDFDDIVAIVQSMDPAQDAAVDLAAPGGSESTDPEDSSGEPASGSGTLDVYDDGDRTCPNGWRLIPNNSTKKNGQDVDANGDGLICEKDIPGNGKGNTNQNTNVKDNNGK